jgi:hypothetical protein
MNEWIRHNSCGKKIFQFLSYTKIKVCTEWEIILVTWQQCEKFVRNIVGGALTHA